MDLTSAVLWLILIGLIVLVPCGCIMTRNSGHRLRNNVPPESN